MRTSLPRLPALALGVAMLAWLAACATPADLPAAAHRWPTRKPWARAPVRPTRPRRCPTSTTPISRP